MRLRALGGLAVEGSELRAPKPMALLAYLTLEGPQDRARLATLFWPEARDRRKSLTVALAHLRAAAPGALGAGTQRAWSNLDSDVHEVLAAFEAGEEERVVERYAGAFLQGVRLPHVGVEVEEWCYGTREFLAEHARLALLALAERDAAQRRLRSATRRAEAAYRLAGAAPAGPDELARLHALLARGRSPLAHAVAAEAQELGVELPVGRAPRRDEAPPTGPLPPLLGREEALSALSRCCREGEDRLVTVVGPPGVGKTRLALELATREHLAGAWEEVRVIPLEALDDPRDLAATVAHALGAPQDGGNAWVAVRDWLGDRPCLLVLDGAERVAAHAAELAELVAACPGTTVVATSRVRLGLLGERAVPLPGLAYPRDAAIGPDEALCYGAVALFVQAARRARPEFVLTEEDVPNVLAVCRRTGGLPLALRLAASWTRLLSCREIADEAERGWEVLRADAADLPERQRDLRGALERSWQLLAPHAREALEGVAVFRDAFPRAAAQAVAGAGLATLAALTDAALLQWDGAGRYRLHPLVRQVALEKAGERPEVLEAFRERHAAFVLGRLAAAPDAPRTGAAEPDTSGPATALDDVMAGWHWAAARGRRDLLGPSVDAVGWLLFKRGRGRLGTRLMEEAAAVLEGDAVATTHRYRAMYEVAAGRAEAALTRLRAHWEPGTSPRERAHRLRVLGVALLGSESPDAAGAQRAFQQAAELYEGAGDAEGAVMMLNNLATVADLHDAVALSERAIGRARETGQRHALAMALTTRAELGLWRTGEYAAARAALDEAIALHEATGFAMPLVDAVLLRAETALAGGELPRAVTAANRAVILCAEFDAGPTRAGREADAQGLRARAALLGASRDEAREASEAASRAARRAGDAAALGRARPLGARAALAAGRAEDAAAEAAEAARLLGPLAEGHDAGVVAARAEALRTLAEAHRLLDRGAEGEARLRDAVALAWRERCLPATLAGLADLGRAWAGAGRRREGAHLVALAASHPASAWTTRRALDGVERDASPTDPGTDPERLETVAAAVRASLDGDGHAGADGAEGGPSTSRTRR